jgi:hypothetical protein
MSVINKRGAAAGEALIMIYRILLVVIVAFTIFFVISVYYNFYVDSLKSEAIVLNRKVVNCLSENGYSDSNLSNYRYNLLDYCGIKDGGVNRLYVRVNVSGDIFEHGDQGIVAISQMFESNNAPGRLYRPGYFSSDYSVYSKDSNNIINMEVKTYVKSEEE